MKTLTVVSTWEEGLRATAGTIRALGKAEQKVMNLPQNQHIHTDARTHTLTYVRRNEKAI